MNFIAGIDLKLFYLLNTRLTFPIFDVVMPFITLRTDFFYTLVIVAVLALVMGGGKDLKGAVLGTAAVFLSGLTTGVLKDLILRERPCHALEGVRLLVKCSRSYSLPSGHATYIFAGMVFLSIRHRKYSPFLMSFAFIVAYSRVYVGVHYPFDVITAAVLGSSWAFFFSWAEQRLTYRLKRL